MTSIQEQIAAAVARVAAWVEFDRKNHPDSIDNRTLGISYENFPITRADLDTIARNHTPVPVDGAAVDEAAVMDVEHVACAFDAALGYEASGRSDLARKFIAAYNAFATVPTSPTEVGGDNDGGLRAAIKARAADWQKYHDECHPNAPTLIYGDAAHLLRLDLAAHPAPQEDGE